MLYLTPEERVKVRKANKDDFSNPDGSKKVDVTYFLQSYYGAIEAKKCVFNFQTNMYDFKTFYASKQVYVYKDIQPINN